ncbi:hypothetical protein SDC9_98085 [bioreactor metagenome]|uniref:Uncharacterized protein n=1 Tax=bioreactor metagenome TaxID=1076179 RepID=A0A645AE87_9ZZZZ
MFAARIYFTLFIMICIDYFHQLYRSDDILIFNFWRSGFYPPGDDREYFVQKDEELRILRRHRQREAVGIGGGGGADDIRRPGVEQQQPAAARSLVQRGAERGGVPGKPAGPDGFRRAHDARYRGTHPGPLRAGEVKNVCPREQMTPDSHRAVDARLKFRKPPLVVGIVFLVGGGDYLHYLLRDERQHRGIEEGRAQFVLVHRRLLIQQLEVFILRADPEAGGVGGTKGDHQLAAAGPPRDDGIPGLVP